MGKWTGCVICGKKIQFDKRCGLCFAYFHPSKTDLKDMVKTNPELLERFKQTKEYEIVSA